MARKKTRIIFVVTDAKNSNMYKMGYPAGCYYKTDEGNIKGPFNSWADTYADIDRYESALQKCSV